MVGELAIRFVLGGLVVSAFAVLGDILQPKSFAGIFGAAPSVALATLGLTFISHGGRYAGLEGQAMIAGAVAMFVYSQATGRLLLQRHANTLLTATLGCLLWLAVAFALWAALLR